jgi:hypothetical protein
VAQRGDETRVSVWGRASLCAAAFLWHLVSGIRHFETSWID